jgi:hypothetical protein
MRQVITKSLLLLIAICFLMVFTGISSRACDKNQFTKCNLKLNKPRQNNNPVGETTVELTDFIFTNSLLRF